MIRSQCSWLEESRTALFVYRSPPSSRWARGVYRLSSMVALYLMPRGGRGQDHEGEVTFPSKTVCLSFKIASGKAASSRKPSRLAREELLLSPQGGPGSNMGRKSPAESKQCHEKEEKKETGE